MLFSIHFLRFIAAYAVILHHALAYCAPEIPITVGAAGVDVFFIISGMVISYSTRPGDSVTTFCIKRFIRILPPYWLATTLYVAFKYFEWKQIPSLDHLWRSIFLIPVLGTNWVPIYYPAWTLCYELFFYLTYAIFLAAFRKNVTIACILTITSISVILIPVPGMPGVFFENRLCLEFVFGLLLIEWWKDNNKIDPRFGIPCILISLLIFIVNYKLGGVDRVLAWGIPSLLLITGVLSFERTRVLRHPFIVALGDSSYAMYLFHITTIEFILQTAIRHGIPLHFINEHKIFSIIFVSSLSIIAGILISKFIEKPYLRFLRNLLFSTRPEKFPVFHAKEFDNKTENASVIHTVSVKDESTPATE
jgi:exopolysaccharide production protein ExoZ